MPIKQIPYSRRELYATGPQRTFVGESLAHIAFPLGGLGTGTVSLGGWGQLRDWEIMNRPAKGRTMPNAFFSVRVQQGNRPPQVKVLQGPPQGCQIGDGHSAPRDAGEGLPHFRRCTFRGEYPFATVALRDPNFPLRAELVAFNPFIPLNDRDSGIPAAILLYTLRNTTRQTLRVSVMGNLTNIIGDKVGRQNRRRRGAGLCALVLSNEALPEDDPQFGTIALCTPAQDAWVWPNWSDDRLLKFWEAIAWKATFPPRKPGHSLTGTIGVNLTLKPGEARTVPFILAWHFPNYEHWRKPPEAERAPTWKNWYATQWPNAWAVARYVWANFDRLYQQTKRFHDALFSSTLPAHVLDAISSQLSVLRTNTCLRLPDGTFYGFEGCNDTAGCCEGSCTHVWNYAQALPYLFPPLQRSMREADWENSMLEDGFVCFRMPLPLGTKGTRRFHPAADGQMGTVIQVFREWQISGDEQWLRKIWPKAKKALEFAWKYWDADKDGTMEGMQHNTYDIEFYGPNTMTGSLYLAALRAAEEIARYLGENEKAAEYRALFESGSRFADRKLFNGEYYEQIVNPKAHEIWPDNLRQLAERHGKDDKFPTWPKWQFGKGCLSDQLIGQWYATMLGLGYLYERKNVRRALRAIFKYNWQPELSDHFCSLRIYALDGEAGLIIATWPRGERPGYAFWFADEVWCGIEYQVASHLIYEGFVDEGLAIVKGVRDRHDGRRRNPWDEFECGHHYVRSMASYALLLALSGFRYSAPEQRIGFAPVVNAEQFRAFFCVASGWGTYAQEVSRNRARVSLSIAYGELRLRELNTALSGLSSAKARLRRRAVSCRVAKRRGGAAFVFDGPVTVTPGARLVIEAT